MTATRIDAAQQIKQGTGFELPLEAGGTGRTDGVARGVIIKAGNPDTTAEDGYTPVLIPAGAVVKPVGINMYGRVAVQAVTDNDDTPIGVALQDIPINGVGFIVTSGYATVLTTGTVEAGDALYASSTDGTASTASGNGGMLGYAVSDAVDGSCVVLVMLGGAAGGGGGGTLATPTVVVPGAYHSGAATSNDQATDAWDGSVPSGLAGAYALGFAFMEADQIPLNYFRWYRQDGGAFQDFTSLISDAAGGDWRMQMLGLSGVLPDVDATSKWAISHPADGWSAHAAVLFTGIASLEDTDVGQGTGTSASLTVQTEPGDIVVVGIGWRAATSIPVTDGAGQTRRVTVVGGFVERNIAVSTKPASSDSSFTTVSFTWASSAEYSIAAAVLRGNVDVGDGHIDIVNDSPLYSRWPHAHHVFRDRMPGVNDDADWYTLGTEWTNTVTGRSYILTDDTVGAAVWTERFLQSAANVPITDAGGHYTSTDVEGALQEAGARGAIVNTDGDPGNTIYVGFTDPATIVTPEEGDVWIERDV